MPHVFTRRTFFAAQNRFTNNAATLTRYLNVPDGTTPDGGHIIDRDQWLSQVNARANGGDILVFIHGFNTDQSEMLVRLKKIETNLAAQGFHGVVVAFDWPSNGSILGYGSDRADAKKVAPHMVVDGLGPLLNLSSGQKLHVLCHSMGAYLTLRGFAGVGDSGGPGTVPWGVDEVLFVSGDCDQDWFEQGAWGGLVLDHRAKRFTNYYSTLDQVLDLSGSIIHGQPRAGHDGLPPAVPAKFNDVYCGQQYINKVPNADKGLIRSHTWFFDDVGFYRDIALTLGGQSPSTLPTRSPVQGSSDLALLT